MKLLIMQSSPAFSTLLGQDILLSTLFSNTISLCSSLSVRNWEQIRTELSWLI